MSGRLFPAVAVNALVAWSLLAFGGVYPWAGLPIVIGTALLALVRPPRLGGSPATVVLDSCLLFALAAGLLQIVPMPPALVARLSPNLAAFDAVTRVDAGLLGEASQTPRPLALAPGATQYTLALAAGMLLLFWTCRTMLAQGGIRRIVRAVSWLGLLVSLEAIVQGALSPGLIYGWWRPFEAGAQPLGPIVNRNHLATWILLALPMTVGYLAAHLRSHRRDRLPRWSMPRLLRASDPRAVWLVVSGSLMLLTLLLSQSRAAFVSLLISAAVGVWLGRRRLDAWSGWALAGYAVVALAVVAAWANFGGLVARFDDLARTASGGRAVIWHDTVAVIRDFWLTGVGAGGYPAAMAAFQVSMRGYFFNHAHSQYLQLATEGGLMVCAPAALAAAAFLRAAGERLRGDPSAISSVRVGAIAGICGVAAQSIWETGLSTPANGVLLAVAAAMALHRPVPTETART
jgi:hypothetical protein